MAHPPAANTIAVNAVVWPANLRVQVFERRAKILEGFSDFESGQLLFLVGRPAQGKEKHDPCPSCHTEGCPHSATTSIRHLRTCGTRPFAAGDQWHVAERAQAKGRKSFAWIVTTNDNDIEDTDVGSAMQVILDRLDRQRKGAKKAKAKRKRE